MERAHEARAHRAGGWRLTVSDQGRGLPNNFDIDTEQGFWRARGEGLCAPPRRDDDGVVAAGHTAFEVSNVEG